MSDVWCWDCIYYSYSYGDCCLGEDPEKNEHIGACPYKREREDEDDHCFT